MDAEPNNPVSEHAPGPDLGAAEPETPSMFGGDSAGDAGPVPSQMPTGPAPHHSDVPESLQVLLSLPGVPRNLFAGVDTDTAWLRAHQIGCDHTLPLAHLAPDAIETLAELGFTGQVRAELRETEKGPVVRYFAFRLPEAQQAEVTTRDTAQDAMLRRFDRLEDALARVADALAQQAQAQQARGAGGLANLDVSTIRDFLALAPQLQKGGRVLKDLIAMFAAEDAQAQAPVSGEDQAQVIQAIVGGLRSLADSELARELMARFLGRGKVVPMRSANAG